MIRITCFGALPYKRFRRGPVYSIALTHPKNVGVDGIVEVLRPTWDMVRGFQQRQISEEEYTAMYRKLMVERWPAVKRWLDSLDSSDLYLCCWEPTGFCHRYLVAKMIRKHRPELEVKVS
jgi:hypothetical protein